MTEQCLALCRAMGAGEGQDVLLIPLIEAVSAALEGRLKRSVTPEHCGSAFPLAVALVAMDGLERATGGSRVASFAAGEVSIRTQSVEQGGLTAQAERLMAPWMEEKGFAFRGVAG